MAGNDAYLRTSGGPNGGTRVPLTDVGAIVIGRGEDNDVEVLDETVSRRHAVIIETRSGFVLRDLASANGTFVNKQMIEEQEHHLEHGDRIRLGASKVSLVFRQKGSPTVGVGDPLAVPTSSRSDSNGEVASVRHISKGGLSRQNAELLKLLESRKLSVVTREEIGELVWPEVPVEVLKLNQDIDRAILSLRAHLHDDPRRPTKLITAGEQGYLLV